MIVVGEKEVHVVEESVMVVGIDEVKTVCTKEVEEEPALSVLELEEDVSAADVVLDDSDANVPDDKDKLEDCDKVDDGGAEEDDNVVMDVQRAHPVLRQSQRP